MLPLDTPCLGNQPLYVINFIETPVVRAEYVFIQQLSGLYETYVIQGFSPRLLSRISSAYSSHI
jgi:hypothetical protein